ncbi:hypothetical protein GJAV_G00179750 [Gymnothorax javanicus]|nr:hypothetical protein GJAV_G00179750 [Gymnothorax javanicus]
MRFRGVLLKTRSYGTSSHRVQFPGMLRAEIFACRGYCSSHQSPKDEASKMEVVKHRTAAALQNLSELGRQWGRNLARTASATANYWWIKYEEFVGLNEVRDAQTKVTEAEKGFMVARGVVREAHMSVEALQGRLKEVRDRLDRVSREEAHYLELATLEHKLLQEERRLRTAYENAEGAERERFSLFSAAVRESHEKERSRAERTKNWSVIGSVLGALIGVMGSTYVNRVRLQELRSLLLEAQKGPASLQEALKEQAGMHHAQQGELRGLIDTLGGLLRDSRAKLDRTGPAPTVPSPAPIPQSPAPSASDSALQELLISTQRAQALVATLPPQLTLLEQAMGKMEAELQAVKATIEARHAVADRVAVSTPDMPVLVCDKEEVISGLAEHWLKEICEQNGWTHSVSPIVWRELVDRGGKGLLLGGFSDFLEHVQGYYGITSDMTSSLMLKIASENQQTEDLCRREEEIQESLNQPKHIWISSALSLTCYHLIPLLCDPDALSHSPVIWLHLLDIDGNSEALEGLAMEVEDLALPQIKGVSTHTCLDQAFCQAYTAILLDEPEPGDEEEGLLRKTAERFWRYGRLLEEGARLDVRVIVAGHSYINLKVSVLLENASSLNSSHFVGVASQLENQARAQLAEKLLVQSAGNGLS